MFADRLLPNLLLFATAIAVAIAWLRTGMILRGVLLLFAVLATADATLLIRFVFADRGPTYTAALTAMQIVAALGIGTLTAQLLRRRLSADLRRRPALFDQGLRHYLRDELPAAQAIFGRLHRVDPWHVPSAIALAQVLARLGRTGAARRLLRSARRLDGTGAFADLIEQRLGRLQRETVAKTAVAREVAAPADKAVG